MTGATESSPLRTPPALLVRALLEDAKIAGRVADLRQFRGGWTNHNWLVELESGSRFVLRQYCWPHDSPEPSRPDKEVHLHGILHQAGVPVARVLSQVKEAAGSALLLSYVSGRLLGDISPDLPPALRNSAWNRCGAALRRAHGLRHSPGEFGPIVGKEVERPQQDSWAHWRVANLIHHAGSVHDRGGPIDVDQLTRVCEDAIPLLNDFQPCLLHNDAHAWNALVDRDGAACRCTAWLDWEYAWVGDPAWDLARTDLWRLKDIGPTPPAFWAGYGQHPPEPRTSFHRMSLLLWQADEQLAAPSPVQAPLHSRALAYITDFPHHLNALRARIDS